MNIKHAAAAVILSAGAVTLEGRDVVEIRLRGRYYSEPATVRVLVAVEPDDANRTLVVEADGERLFRSSEVTLEGDRDQRVHTVEFKNLPAGEYVLRAEVRSASKIRGIDEAQLLVVGEPINSR
jgi:hypothetical protein